MATRQIADDDFGWSVPVNLGAIINTDSDEVSPGYFENQANGTEILYFTSDRPGTRQSSIKAHETLTAHLIPRRMLRR